MHRIAIIGAGVAGSNLAAWLATNNFEAQVHIYDPQLIYQKPCGNVLLPEALEYLAVKPEITNIIKEYEVWVNNKRIISFSLEKNSSWMIIDKEKLVSSLRETWLHKYNFIRKAVNIDELKSNYDLVIDARGPFSNNGLNKILVARGIFEPNQEVTEKIILNFDTVNVGISWIFPYRDKLNIGYGAIRVSNPLEKLRSFIETMRIGILMKNVSGQPPLTIDYPLTRAINGNVVWTGEALGLVLALGGEGNRLAIISSKILADVLIRNEKLDVYQDKLRKLIKETVKQGFVLKLLSSINDYESIAKSMSKLDVDFYKQFLLGYFNLAKALPVGIKTRVFLKGPARLYAEFIKKYLALLI